MKTRIFLGILFFSITGHVYSNTSLHIAIQEGIASKLAIKETTERVSEDALREYLLALLMQKMMHDVPEFLDVVDAFYGEGGFQKDAIFSFDLLFKAIDHGAIRVHQHLAKNVPLLFAPFGLKTRAPGRVEYDFIPTGKPLQACAYGPYEAYGKKDKNQFRIFVSSLRLDLLSDDIQKRTEAYIKLVTPGVSDRTQLLANKAIGKGLTAQEAKEYAQFIVENILTKKTDAPSLKEYDDELYFILKRAAPEIFNALIFGPSCNHLAIDLRKAGIEKWGSGNNFREAIDQFWRDIQKLGFSTLPGVQGDFHDQSIKVRQTSVKMRQKNDTDNCCYIEFITRLPEQSIPELLDDYKALVRPDMSFAEFIENAPVYQGFHTYNATHIYHSNRSGDAYDSVDQVYDEASLKRAIADAVKHARAEYHEQLLYDKDCS